MTPPATVARITLPDSTVRTDDDFTYIPWWTDTTVAALLAAVTAPLWCLLCDLVTGTGTVSDHRLRAAVPEVLAVMEALWLRRAPRPQPGPGGREVPGRFTALTGTDPGPWRDGTGRVGAAWCLARLTVYAHRTGTAAACRCGRHDPAVTAAAVAWRTLTGDDGSYLYTTDLAGRYDQDRPHSPHFSHAITTIAATHLTGRVVAEFGAGTGAITGLLAPAAATVHAIEPAVGMRALLHRATTGTTAVRVRGEDCMAVTLPAQCCDAVAEHAALCFVDEPVYAVAEAARLLRPGGILLRLLSRRTHPPIVTDFTTAFHAALRRHGHPRGRIVSNGNDPRLTDWLATCGITTRLDTVATWTEPLPLHQVTAPLTHGSYPYLTAIPATDRARAVDTALAATGLSGDTILDTTVTVATATSVLGGVTLSPRAPR
ncbi:class I SAM-dependent methyltransferase [Nocardia sp. alder85J]|uniref:class I SAM-dependent methyltransferase n=1 Tax=Nocardia sp. alder85J TaxID=2862949 RepID=UPI001CD4DE95|nr:class I SAM-dependent methyltransferase [Nocardia sp. alder85J]MCX4097761.1 class I SAM-dependent methyltransferase [Nocardia sp. alder85J]